MKKILNFKKFEIDTYKISGGTNDSTYQGHKDCIVETDCGDGTCGSDVAWGDCCGIDPGGNPFDFEKIDSKAFYFENPRLEETHILNFNF